jgi:pyridoxal/pyridoxine/pyridoxamine kinase
MSLKAGSRRYLDFYIPQADLLAPNAIELVIPEDGVIEAVRSVVQTAITTGGTLTLKKTVTTALDTVVSAALTQTIANSATKGTQQLTTDLTGLATLKVSAGDRVAIVPAGFATAGAMYGMVTLRSLSLAPALP